MLSVVYKIINVDTWFMGKSFIFCQADRVKKKENLSLESQKVQKKRRMSLLLYYYTLQA